VKEEIILKNIKDTSIKRILCIVGSMNIGGAETQLMKLYRALDKEKYQMDFFVSSKTPGFYDEEIASLGGAVIYSNTKAEGVLKYYKKLYLHVKKHSYSSVVRLAANSLSFVDLLPGAITGVKSLALRSST
jgi:hypothetical protein